jgi:NADH:ubiquinone oxidoreductase subunit 3 (subunit A)
MVFLYFIFFFYLFVVSSYEYLYIFLSIIIVTLISFLPFVLSYILNYQDPNIEKISAYECGFQPFDDSRQRFNIEFYLIGILFVIFDLEIVFLFPICISLHLVGIFGIFIISLFIVLLSLDSVMNYLKEDLNCNYIIQVLL